MMPQPVIHRLVMNPGRVREWRLPGRSHGPSHQIQRMFPGFRRGGEFTDIFGAQPARITPILAGDVYSRRVLDQCIQGLAGLDPETLETRGVLADAWQYDPGWTVVAGTHQPEGSFQ